jgi:hypothetical protein
MRGERLQIESIVSSAELQCALQEELSRCFGRELRIVDLVRRISEYCSSFIIEELDVTLDDGSTLELIFKDLSKAALLSNAGQIKPAFFYNPLREIDTYRKVLSQHQLGTAMCFGAFVDPEEKLYWLFLERVKPVLLWQMGDMDSWNETARWLAGMHSFLVRETEIRESQHIAHLIKYDEKFYRRWIDRAVEFVHEGDTSPGREAANAVSALAANYDRVIEHMLSLPVTVIHGEFFASNIMIDSGPDYFRLCPVDWEMAAVAPGPVDLAGLTSGNWTTSQKNTMARAYYEALPESSPVKCGWRKFLIDLEFCRLHQAVQWLGWSPGWTPPPEHKQNWLKEAVRCAKRLLL